MKVATCLTTVLTVKMTRVNLTLLEPVRISHHRLKLSAILTQQHSQQTGGNRRNNTFRIFTTMPNLPVVMKVTQTTTIRRLETTDFPNKLPRAALSRDMILGPI